MSPKRRYTLIAAGIIAFVVLTPLIVIFVTGIKYDFKTHRFIKTGLISVNTDPKNAQLVLNGQSHGTTPETVRFLVPGSYDVKLQKPGYFDWTKRLNVRAQFVSYAKPDSDKLYMFFSSPQQTNLSDGVFDLYAGKNKFLYATANQIFYADQSNPRDTQTLTLPKTPDHLNIVGSDNEKDYLIFGDGSYFVFDAGKNKITDISSLINLNSSGDSSAVKQKLQFSGDKLYYLEGQNLFKIDWQALTKSQVLSNILFYSTDSRNLYLIAQDNDSMILSQANESDYGQRQLLADLPIWNQASIYAAGQNQLFVVGDGTLYNVSDHLIFLADFVKNVSTDIDDHSIIFSTSNEIDIYNYLDGKLTLITRSAQAVQDPQGNLQYGWVFFLNDGRLQNIENDNQDHQNNYTFAQVSAQAKYFVDDKSENVFLLDSGGLKMLKIR